MRDLPSNRTIVSLVQAHFGLTLAEAIEAIKTPIHPRGLRDDFAAKAMQAYLSDTAASWNNEGSAQAAQAAYRVADAMLEARAK